MISIVITSYNYARFLRASIDSALSQSYPCEVIVVDDGSTDESVDIIKSYGNRVRFFPKENGGEASAMWEGFTQARFDTVIFLDSDDILYPSCAETILPYIDKHVSKIQYRLDKIDSHGKNLLMPFPYFPENMSPEDVLRMVLTSGYYPAPVNTGIAYSRTYLEKVLPVQDVRFRDNADGYLTVLAPIYGQVISLDHVLGAYRVHDSNFWTNDARLDRYSMYVAHELARQELFVLHAQRTGLISSLDAVFKNMMHLENRMLSLRLSPKNHPVIDERRLLLFIRSIYNVLICRDFLVRGRILWIMYITLICWIPVSLLPALVAKARGSQRRARWATLLIKRSYRARYVKTSRKVCV